MWAAEEGHAEVVRALLAAGANVAARSKSGFTPLLFAVRNAEIEALRVLLDHGANVNDLAPDGTSALNVAIMNAYYEVASMLLDHGADPNVRVDWQEIRFDTVAGTTRNPPGLTLGRHLLTYNGATAFYVAAKNGEAPLMRLLAETAQIRRSRTASESLR